MTEAVFSHFCCSCAWLYICISVMDYERQLERGIPGPLAPFHLLADWNVDTIV